jgi:hypothetical protein
MTKHPGGSKRNYYDEERLKAIAEIRRALPEILEYGTEDDFVELIKKWRKDVTPEELTEWIKLFRASVPEKRGLDWRFPWTPSPRDRTRHPSSAWILQ